MTDSPPTELERPPYAPEKPMQIPDSVLDRPTVGSFRRRGIGEVERLADQLLYERELRVDKHRDRIRILGQWLGRSVTRHEVTITDAASRLDAVAHALDPEHPIPLFLVPFKEAEEIAEVAYRQGLADG